MDILCIGSTLADVTAWPVDTVELAHKHVLGSKTSIGPGGCATNVSWGLASLGKSVSLLSRVGNDAPARLVRELLNERGVDTSLMRIDNQTPTGITIVMVEETGERRFLYTPGANAEICADDLNGIQLSDYRLLHISDTFLLTGLEGEPLTSLLAEAQSKGVLTSMDTVWDPSGRWMEQLVPYLPHLDIFLVSEEEARHLLPGMDPNRIVTRFLELGAGTVLLKRGEKGSLAAAGNERLVIPAEKVEPRDTTGAGDAYAAGFLAATLEGRNLAEAARAATRLATHSIAALGATSGIRRFADTRELFP
ncbi:MAG: sugar kinase [Acidobacteriota bacterium]|nr:sugar kinase [Acidobacteriota bacterium]